jgi:hypothetical protein
VRVENEKLERLAMEKLLAVEKKAAENVLELAEEETRIAKGKTIEEKSKLETAKAILEACQKDGEKHQLLKEEELLKQQQDAEEEAKITTEVTRETKRRLAKERRSLDKRIRKRSHVKRNRKNLIKSELLSKNAWRRKCELVRKKKSDLPKKGFQPNKLD